MTLSRLLLVALFALLPTSGMLAAEQSVQLEDGSSVRLFFFEPPADLGPPPLAIFIAGGSSNEFMAKTQFWLGKEFVDRGWAIAVPISPDGTQFSERDRPILPQLIAQIYATNTLQAGKPLLVGMSSGGSEALRLATLKPELYRGVVAAPGRIKSDTEIAPLGGLPLYVRVGEKDDFRWNRMLDSMTARLREAGAEVDSAIVADARHVFQLDWESLETWLTQLK